jgi:hypothetical protein
MAGAIDIRGVHGAQQAMANLSASIGVDVRFIAYDQMRLWLIDLVKKSGGDPRLSLSKQKQAGKGAIWDDLNKIFNSDFDTVDEWTRDTTQGTTYFVESATGAIYGVDETLYKPSASISQMHRYHSQLRGKKGRVKRQTPQTTRRGGYTEVNKMYVKANRLKKFAKELHSHIGTIKAAWVPALQVFARKSRGGTGRIPAWLMQNTSRAPDGQTQDNMTKYGSGTLKASNNLDWARDAIRQSLINSTAATRQMDLFKQSKKRIERLVERFNRQA